MPWRVRKSPVKNSGNYAIQKKTGNKWKTVGRSDSKSKAQASVRARYNSKKK